MGVLVKIAVLIVSISFFVFVIFFGRLPALRNTPIGVLNRGLRVHIPNGFRAMDSRLTNGRVTASSSRFIHHIMNDRHPTILIFFLLLLAVSEYLWVPRVYPTLSFPMKFAAATIIFTPYLFLFLASYVDPGYITLDNLDFHGTLYPYDHALYIPSRMCSTCNQLKPPRSKHCSVCRRCVSKLDHHCIFINGCVGYGNAHYFVLLLLTTAILTTSGAYLGAIFLRDFIQLGYPHFTLRGAGLSWSVYFTFWSYILQEEPFVGGVSLLCALTSPLIYGLYFYNVYLIYRGLTTNETGKWSDFQLDCDDGYVFRRELGEGRVKDAMVEPEVPEWPKECKHIYVRTSDESPPLDANIPGEGAWHHVWSLKEVDNLYDLGFLLNLGDMFLSRRAMKSFLGNGSKSL